MQISEFLKSVIDSDDAPIVICDINHDIVYMNPSSIKKYGGRDITGKSIFDCHNGESVEKIKKVVDWFKSSENNNKVFTYRNDEQNKDVYMIALRNENNELIGYYEKHEFRNNETEKLYNID
ncbi:MAG: PAS domain-containing protein [Oscillospiraceae bacterium]|nr:PAS domain-containing protein [Oscillospiraceae bacterium]